MKRCLALLFGGMFGLAAFAAQAADTTKTGVVETAYGPVQGIVKGPVAEFLGIPFAAPPVGDLRWHPPQAPASWSATRDASQFGKTCAQPDRGVFATPSTSEDCLYLNVFAPKAAPGHAGHRAVMVWFYGGGLFSGESNDYDGSKLAARGDVILVSFNYRLGALGIFSHPAINAEGHPFANYAIMDQQFALHWVKQNIAVFGGDPNNVTIFGQSSGGGSVVANLVSPLAAGLFQHAIVESGSSRLSPMPPEAAAKAAQDFATAVGCPDQSAACLRAVPVEKVLASQGSLALLSALDFPMVDGTVIPRTAPEAFKTGQFNHVPILTGIVRDEQAFFLPETNTGKPLTADEYDHFLASFGAANTDKLRAKYKLANYPSPSVADIEVTELGRVCASRIVDRMWVKYGPVYTYQFNDRTAPSYLQPLSYPTGAYHSSEVQYLFPLYHGGRGTPHPLNAVQTKLSDRMIAAWTQFARSGTPSSAWKPYAPARDNVMLLDTSGLKAITGYGAKSDCDIWDPIFAY